MIDRMSRDVRFRPGHSENLNLDKTTASASMWKGRFFFGRLRKKPNISVVRPPAPAIAVFLVSAAYESTPHSSEFARLDLELFTKPSKRCFSIKAY
jgi:hypothetical protein